MSDRIRGFLDKKHGKFVGRVYMLVMLFVFNACIAVGASMYYTFGNTIMVMYTGIIGTIICIGVLSIPVNISNTEIQINESSIVENSKDE